MDNIALRIAVGLVVVLVISVIAAVSEVEAGVWERTKDLPRPVMYRYRFVLMLVGAAWLTLAFWIAYGRLPQ